MQPQSPPCGCSRASSADVSTGTNFFGLCWAAARMRAVGETGSLVTLICDSGERYRTTYYSEDWLREAAIDPAPYEAVIRSEEHTSELQSHSDLVCRLLL